MRHPLRGLLIGPLVAPFAYWVGVLLFAQRDAGGLDFFRALRELKVIFAIGLPVAYAATLLFGAPMLYGLKRLRWLSAPSLVAAGAVCGTIVAVMFGIGQLGSAYPVRMPLSAGAALGALAAGGCWWAGR